MRPSWAPGTRRGTQGGQKSSCSARPRTSPVVFLSARLRSMESASPCLGLCHPRTSGASAYLPPRPYARTDYSVHVETDMEGRGREERERKKKDRTPSHCCVKSPLEHFDSSTNDKFAIRAHTTTSLPMSHGHTQKARRGCVVCAKEGAKEGAKKDAKQHPHA
jgi:hypothetical protein